MPSPPFADKNAIINQFITDVIDHAVNQVQRHRSDVPFLPNNTTSPIVYKNSLRVSPDDLSTIAGEPSAVPSRGGLINASALVDLFLHYSHNLTSIRRCTLRRINQPSSSASYVTVWSNQITSLNADYKMSVWSFNSSVRSGGVLDDLAPGNVAETSSITTLINRLQTVVDNHMASAVTVTICHTSCHSSCHGSRGRR